MHSKTAISSEQLRLDIANINGAIKRISELKYIVKSQNGKGDYEINSTDLGWMCACADHKYRGVKCKHIFAVEISYALHKEVEVAPIDVDCCIYCNSFSIVMAI
jgi:putative transposase